MTGDRIKAWLHKFILESNAIEGIHRPPTFNEYEAHLKFLALPVIEDVDLEEFVAEVQHGAVLRDRKGLDVIVGSHTPPPGGPTIRDRLVDLLLHLDIKDRYWTPHGMHREYEDLHPFTDGNGRSGRVLWAWHMDKLGLFWRERGFLHTWYYQSLEASR